MKESEVFNKNVQSSLAKVKHLYQGEFNSLVFSGDVEQYSTIIESLVNKLIEQKAKESEYEARFEEIGDVLNGYLLHDYSQKAYVSDSGDIVDALAVSINLFGEELEESINIVERQKNQLLASSVSRSELEIANEEIKILLREVHHRVKNNLQVITSLIALQSARLEDEAALMVFQDLQNRISSMAIVHELLYQTADVSRINYQEYLTALIERLVGLFRTEEKNIEIKINVSDVLLNIETSIPLGLFVNEVVTNSLKHAFVGRNKGMISVGLTKEGCDCFLVIEDNGNGLGVDYQDRLGTLGMRLIKNLSKQLNGTLKRVDDNGTKYMLSFKELK